MEGLPISISSWLLNKNGFTTCNICFFNLVMLHMSYREPDSQLGLHSACDYPCAFRVQLMVHSQVDFPDTSVQRPRLRECVTREIKAMSGSQNSVLRFPAQNDAQFLMLDHSEHGREILSLKAQCHMEIAKFHWMLAHHSIAPNPGPVMAYTLLTQSTLANLSSQNEGTT